MNSRPYVEVDEDALLAAMLEVPAMQHRQPPGAMALLGKPTRTEAVSAPSVPESHAPASAYSGEAMQTGETPEAVSVQSEPTQSEPARRGPYRKKRPEDEQAYRDLYLVNDGVCSRVSTYINRDTHEKIKKLLSAAAPDISIVSYINNILNHHLDRHQELLDGMFRSGSSSPFQS